MIISSTFFIRILRINTFVLIAIASLGGCQDNYWLSPYWGQRYAEQTPIPSDRFILQSADDTIVGRVQVVIARYEDTLPDIARRFNLGYEEIVAANPGVDPWLPGEGTRIVLPTQFILPNAPQQGIVLNLATLRLFYFPKIKPGQPRVVFTHPIGIGRVGWATPTGKTRITRKEKDPTWYVPASVLKEHAEKGDPLPAQVPPGPDNPLGSHVLRLAMPSYLIHGTNKPYGVGMRVSHGCVRLYPEDIESLYEKVPVGTPVYIVNQPYLVGWQKGRFYLETHPPLKDDQRNWRKRLQILLKTEIKKGPSDRPVDWKKANRLAKNPPGLPVPILQGDPDIEDILARAPIVENTVPKGVNYTKEFQVPNNSRKVGLID